MFLFKFSIMAASPEFHSVTSVAFLPNADILAFSDFLENVFNETTTGGPKSRQKQYGAVVDTGVPRKQVNLGNRNKFQQGFGFQIHTGILLSSHSNSMQCCLGGYKYVNSFPIVTLVPDSLRGAKRE